MLDERNLIPNLDLFLLISKPCLSNNEYSSVLKTFLNGEQNDPPLKFVLLALLIKHSSENVAISNEFYTKLAFESKAFISYALISKNFAQIFLKFVLSLSENVFIDYNNLFKSLTLLSDMDAKLCENDSIFTSSQNKFNKNLVIEILKSCIRTSFLLEKLVSFYMDSGFLSIFTNFQDKEKIVFKCIYDQVNGMKQFDILINELDNISTIIDLSPAGYVDAFSMPVYQNLYQNILENLIILNLTFNLYASTIITKPNEISTIISLSKTICEKMLASTKLNNIFTTYIALIELHLSMLVIYHDTCINDLNRELFVQSSSFYLQSKNFGLKMFDESGYTNTCFQFLSLLDHFIPQLFCLTEQNLSEEYVTSIVQIYTCLIEIMYVCGKKVSHLTSHDHGLEDLSEKEMTKSTFMKIVTDCAQKMNLMISVSKSLAIYERLKSFKHSLLICLIDEYIFAKKYNPSQTDLRKVVLDDCYESFLSNGMLNENDLFRILNQFGIKFDTENNIVSWPLDIPIHLIYPIRLTLQNIKNENHGKSLGFGVWKSIIKTLVSSIQGTNEKMEIKTFSNIISPENCIFLASYFESLPLNDKGAICDQILQALMSIAQSPCFKIDLTACIQLSHLLVLWDYVLCNFHKAAPVMEQKIKNIVTSNNFESQQNSLNGFGITDLERSIGSITLLFDNSSNYTTRYYVLQNASDYQTYGKNLKIDSLACKYILASPADYAKLYEALIYLFNLTFECGRIEQLIKGELALGENISTITNRRQKEILFSTDLTYLRILLWKILNYMPVPLSTIESFSGLKMDQIITQSDKTKNNEPQDNDNTNFSLGHILNRFCYYIIINKEFGCAYECIKSDLIRQGISMLKANLHLSRIQRIQSRLDISLKECNEILLQQFFEPIVHASEADIANYPRNIELCLLHVICAKLNYDLIQIDMGCYQIDHERLINGKIYPIFIRNLIHIIRLLHFVIKRKIYLDCLILDQNPANNNNNNNNKENIKNIIRTKNIDLDSYHLIYSQAIRRIAETATIKDTTIPKVINTESINSNTNSVPIPIAYVESVLSSQNDSQLQTQSPLPLYTKETPCALLVDKGGDWLDSYTCCQLAGIASTNLLRYCLLIPITNGTKANNGPSIWKPKFNATQIRLSSCKNSNEKSLLVPTSTSFVTSLLSQSLCKSLDRWNEQLSTMIFPSFPDFSNVDNINERIETMDKYYNDLIMAHIKTFRITDEYWENETLGLTLKHVFHTCLNLIGSFWKLAPIEKMSNELLDVLFPIILDARTEYMTSDIINKMEMCLGASGSYQFRFNISLFALQKCKEILETLSIQTLSDQVRLNLLDLMQMVISNDFGMEAFFTAFKTGKDFQILLNMIIASTDVNKQSSIIMGQKIKQNCLKFLSRAFYQLTVFRAVENHMESIDNFSTLILFMEENIDAFFSNILLNQTQSNNTTHSSAENQDMSMMDTAMLFTNSRYLYQLLKFSFGFSSLMLPETCFNKATYTLHQISLHHYARYMKLFRYDVQRREKIAKALTYIWGVQLLLCNHMLTVPQQMIDANLNYVARNVVDIIPKLMEFAMEILNHLANEGLIKHCLDFTPKPTNNTKNFHIFLLYLTGFVNTILSAISYHEKRAKVALKENSKEIYLKHISLSGKRILQKYYLDKCKLDSIDHEISNDKYSQQTNNSICTYAYTNKEFINQHWYNCHTCGMVDGVGICTVCVRICHKNHDVTYSKFGSFFCDCGAKEDDSCQALKSALPENDIESLSNIDIKTPIELSCVPNKIDYSKTSLSEMVNFEKELALFTHPENSNNIEILQNYFSLIYDNIFWRIRQNGTDLYNVLMDKNLLKKMQQCMAIYLHLVSSRSFETATYSKNKSYFFSPIQNFLNSLSPENSNDNLNTVKTHTVEYQQIVVPFKINDCNNPSPMLIQNEANWVDDTRQLDKSLIHYNNNPFNLDLNNMKDNPFLFSHFKMYIKCGTDTHVDGKALKTFIIVTKNKNEIKCYICDSNSIMPVPNSSHMEAKWSLKLPFSIKNICVERNINTNSTKIAVSGTTELALLEIDDYGMLVEPQWILYPSSLRTNTSTESVNDHFVHYLNWYPYTTENTHFIVSSNNAASRLHSNHSILKLFWLEHLITCPPQHNLGSDFQNNNSQFGNETKLYLCVVTTESIKILRFSDENTNFLLNLFICTEDTFLNSSAKSNKSFGEIFYNFTVPSSVQVDATIFTMNQTKSYNTNENTNEKPEKDCQNTWVEDLSLASILLILTNKGTVHWQIVGECVPNSIPFYITNTLDLPILYNEDYVANEDDFICGGGISIFFHSTTQTLLISFANGTVFVGQLSLSVTNFNQPLSVNLEFLTFYQLQLPLCKNCFSYGSPYDYEQDPYQPNVVYCKAMINYNTHTKDIKNNNHDNETNLIDLTTNAQENSTIGDFNSRPLILFFGADKLHLADLNVEMENWTDVQSYSSMLVLASMIKTLTFVDNHFYVLCENGNLFIYNLLGFGRANYQLLDILGINGPFMDVEISNNQSDSQIILREPISKLVDELCSDMEEITLPQQSVVKSPKTANDDKIVHDLNYFETCHILSMPPPQHGIQTGGTLSTNAPQYGLNAMNSFCVLNQSVNSPLESSNISTMPVVLSEDMAGIELCFGGRDFLEIYDKERLKRRLTTPGLYIAYIPSPNQSSKPSSPLPQGMGTSPIPKYKNYATLEIYLKSANKSKNKNTHLSYYIAGIQVQIGVHSTNRNPTFLQIDDYNAIQIKPTKKSRWFDFHLDQRDASERNPIVLKIGLNNTDPRRITVIDNIRIYLKCNSEHGTTLNGFSNAKNMLNNIHFESFKRQISSNIIFVLTNRYFLNQPNNLAMFNNDFGTGSLPNLISLLTTSVCTNSIYLYELNSQKDYSLNKGMIPQWNVFLDDIYQKHLKQYMYQNTLISNAIENSLIEIFSDTSCNELIDTLLEKEWFQHQINVLKQSVDGTLDWNDTHLLISAIKFCHKIWINRPLTFALYIKNNLSTHHINNFYEYMQSEFPLTTLISVKRLVNYLAVYQYIATDKFYDNKAINMDALQSLSSRDTIKEYPIIYFCPLTLNKYINAAIFAICEIVYQTYILPYHSLLLYPLSECATDVIERGWDVMYYLLSTGSEIIMESTIQSLTLLLSHHDAAFKELLNINLPSNITEDELQILKKFCQPKSAPNSFNIRNCYLVIDSFYQYLLEKFLQQNSVTTLKSLSTMLLSCINLMVTALHNASNHETAYAEKWSQIIIQSVSMYHGINDNEKTDISVNQEINICMHRIIIHVLSSTAILPQDCLTRLFNFQEDVMICLDQLLKRCIEYITANVKIMCQAPLTNNCINTHLIYYKLMLIIQQITSVTNLMFDSNNESKEVTVSNNHKLWCKKISQDILPQLAYNCLEIIYCHTQQQMDYKKQISEFPYFVDSLKHSTSSEISLSELMKITHYTLYNICCGHSQENYLAHKEIFGLHKLWFRLQDLLWILLPNSLLAMDNNSFSTLKDNELDENFIDHFCQNWYFPNEYGQYELDKTYSVVTQTTQLLRTILEHIITKGSYFTHFVKIIYGCEVWPLTRIIMMDEKLMNYKRVYLFSALMQMSWLFKESDINLTIQKVLMGCIKTLRNLSPIPMAKQLLQEINSNITIYIKVNLIQMEDEDIRWLARSFLLTYYDEILQETQQRSFFMIYILPMLPVTLSGGFKSLQFLDIICYMITKGNTTNSKSNQQFGFDTDIMDICMQYLSFINESIIQNPRIVIYNFIDHFLCEENHDSTHNNHNNIKKDASHPNKNDDKFSDYNEIAFEKSNNPYYLESYVNCLQCAPMHNYANIKLSSIKKESKYTASSIIVRLLTFHKICSFQVKINEIKKIKMVKTLSIHINNNVNASIVELKNAHKNQWLTILDQVVLQPAQSWLKIDLPIPVIAHNVKIEYDSFYGVDSNDLNYADRSSDIFCPKCNLIVHSITGVCSNCGENAFQCSKCRSINYDDREPYLCTNCGLCKYAKFEYFINARPCVAIGPITNDSIYNKAVSDYEDLWLKYDKNQKMIESYALSLRELVSNFQDHDDSEGSNLDSKLSQIRQKYYMECKYIYLDSLHMIRDLSYFQRSLLKAKSFLGKSIAIDSEQQNKGEQGYAPSEKLNLCDNNCMTCLRKEMDHCLTLITTLATLNTRLKDKIRNAPDIIPQLMVYNMVFAFPKTSILLNILSNQSPIFTVLIDNVLTAIVIKCAIETKNDNSKTIEFCDNHEIKAFTIGLNEAIDNYKNIFFSTWPLISNCLKHLSQSLTYYNEGWEEHLKCVMRLTLLIVQHVPPNTLTFQRLITHLVKIIFHTNLLCGLKPKLLTSIISNTDLTNYNPILALFLPSFKRKNIRTNSRIRLNSSPSKFKNVSPRRKASLSPVKKTSSSSSKNILTIETQNSDTFTTLNGFRKWLWNSYGNNTVINKETSFSDSNLIDPNNWITILLLSPNTKARKIAVGLLKTLMVKCKNPYWRRYLLGLLTQKTLQNYEHCEDYLQLLNITMRKDIMSAKTAAIIKAFDKQALENIILRVIADVKMDNGRYEFNPILFELIELYEIMQIKYKIESNIEFLFNVYLDLKSSLLTNKENLSGVRNIVYTLLMKSILITTSNVRSVSYANIKKICTVITETLGCGPDNWTKLAIAIDIVKEIVEKHDVWIEGKYQFNRDDRQHNMFDDDVSDSVLTDGGFGTMMGASKKSMDKFYMIIEKDVNQEDFIQGRMPDNPYSSLEEGLGPTMKDIKNKICRDCELFALLDDDSCMELLVDNKIVNLSLRVKDVYQKVWRVTHPNSDTMVVIYRIRGLLGDATETFIESFDAIQDKRENSDESKNDNKTIPLKKIQPMNTLVLVLKESHFAGFLLTVIDSLQEPMKFSNLLFNTLKIIKFITKPYNSQDFNNHDENIILDTLNIIFKLISLFTRQIVKSSLRSGSQTINTNRSSSPLLSYTENAIDKTRDGLIKICLEIALQIMEHNIEGNLILNPEWINTMLYNIESLENISQSNALIEKLIALLPYMLIGANKAMIFATLNHYNNSLNFEIYDAEQPLSMTQKFDDLCIFLNSCLKVYENESKNPRVSHNSFTLQIFLHNLISQQLHMSPTKQISNNNPEILERDGIIIQALTYISGRAGHQDWKNIVTAKFPSLSYVLKLLNTFYQMVSIQQMPKYRDMLQKRTITPFVLPDITPLIKLLHKLEQASTEDRLGTLAETLMNTLLKSDPCMQTKIENIREQTKHDRKKIAMAKRNKRLESLGMKTNTKGQVLVSTKIVSPLSEETGFVCCICFEGYHFQPNKVLGIYNLLRKNEWINLSQSTKRMAFISFSNFNLVHIDCHADSIKQTKCRNEWEGATLINSNIACNALLPLWGATVSETSFAQALNKFFKSVRDACGIKDVTYEYLFHDIKGILQRFAIEKYFTDDQCIGSKESNLKIIPYLLSVACYLVIQHNLLSNIESNLKTFLEIYSQPFAFDNNNNINSNDENLSSTSANNTSISITDSTLNRSTLEETLKNLYVANHDDVYYYSVTALLCKPKAWWLNQGQRLLYISLMTHYLRHEISNPNDHDNQISFQGFCRFTANWDNIKPPVLFHLLCQGLCNIVMQDAIEDGVLWLFALSKYLQNNDEQIIKKCQDLLVLFDKWVTAKSVDNIYSTPKDFIDNTKKALRKFSEYII